MEREILRRKLRQKIKDKSISRSKTTYHYQNQPNINDIDVNNNMLGASMISEVNLCVGDTLVDQRKWCRKCHTEMVDMLFGFGSDEQLCDKCFFDKLN